MAELNLKPKKIDLFSDDRAFELMTTAVDETKVDTELFKAEEPSTKGIHTALLAAGMAPGIGNLADAADALLFLAEGELGEAAWSMGAMLPFIGQYVSGRRALKIAKEAGEKTITVYRGVDKWYPKRKMVEGDIVDTGNTMVRKGKIVGGGRWSKSESGLPIYDEISSETKDAVWVSIKKQNAKVDWNTFDSPFVPKSEMRQHPLLMVFEIPITLAKKYSRQGMNFRKTGDLVFEGGIPKKYLVKVEGYKKGKGLRHGPEKKIDPNTEYIQTKEGGMKYPKYSRES